LIKVILNCCRQAATIGLFGVVELARHGPGRVLLAASQPIRSQTTKQVDLVGFLSLERHKTLKVHLSAALRAGRCVR
jgi:hypothetical protein